MQSFIHDSHPIISNIASRFSRNSEAFTSELLEIFETATELLEII